MNGDRYAEIDSELDAWLPVLLSLNPHDFRRYAQILGNMSSREIDRRNVNFEYDAELQLNPSFEFRNATSERRATMIHNHLTQVQGYIYFPRIGYFNRIEMCMILIMYAEDPARNYYEFSDDDEEN